MLALENRLTLLPYSILCTRITLPETNIAPENGWLEEYFPFGKAFWRVLC